MVALCGNVWDREGDYGVHLAFYHENDAIIRDYLSTIKFVFFSGLTVILGT